MWTAPVMTMTTAQASGTTSPACVPDLSGTTVTLRHTSVGRTQVEVTALVSGLPTACTCDAGLPKLEAYWQYTGQSGGASWQPLTGTSTATTQVTGPLGQNGRAEYDVTIRVTCGSAEGPVWSCTRAAVSLRRDGNSANIVQTTITPTFPDRCDSPEPTYP